MSIHCLPGPRACLLSTVTVLALGAAPAVAQEAEETVFQMLGRIILGAGTAKVAIDTPQAVTALEQEDLDRKQAGSIGEVLKGVPGVQAAGASARPMGQAFNIRGIGNSEQTASEERIKVICWRMDGPSLWRASAARWTGGWGPEPWHCGWMRATRN